MRSEKPSDGTDGLDAPHGPVNPSAPSPPNLGEAGFGFGIVALGGLMLVETLRGPSFSQAFASGGVPGPAFLPFWTALGLLGVGFVLTARGLRRPGTAAPVEWPGREGWMRIGATVLALALVLLLLNFLGFAVAAYLFVLAVTYSLGTTSRTTLFFVPIAAASVLHIIFGVLLKVPLPKGIIAFLG